MLPLDSTLGDDVDDVDDDDDDGDEDDDDGDDDDDDDDDINARVAYVAAGNRFLHHHACCARGS